MLAEELIANMRKNVSQRWAPWLLAGLSIVLLALAIARLYMVDVLCQRTGITWSQIWTAALSGPDLNTIYVGAELRAQAMLFMSAFNIVLAIMLATYAFGADRQRKNNILLLEYIDKEKSAR